ncbi:2OG-Fe(II) oxygenase [Roseovarius sp. E0-M6]|uniref:2OG-Fe(II) oxygenase n=1 Tax=Roseovarius sp. E0-M6 TaxID=3127118 RepID=UPI00300FD063
MLDLAKIRARLCHEIRAAELHHAPFPHFWLDNVFTSAEMEQIVQVIRDETHFQDVGSGMKVLEIWKEAENLKQVSAQRAHFLRALNCDLFTQSIAELIFQRFRPSLMKNFETVFGADAKGKLDAIALSDWDLAGAINIRAQGNQLPPHIDWPNRLVSVVLYLDPDGGADESWGTRLFDVDRANIVDPWSNFAKVPGITEPDINIDSYSLIPFKHGRIAIFLNSLWSYHGAFITPTNNAARRWCMVKGINMTLEKTEEIFALPKELRLF